MDYKITDYECIPCCDYCHFYIDDYISDNSAEFTGYGTCVINKKSCCAYDGCDKFKCADHNFLNEEDIKQIDNFYKNL